MNGESIVIAGYYGFGNAGDELILHSLVKTFRQENPQIAITVLSLNPSETAARFGVNAVDRWRPWQWIAPLTRSRRFLLGGGGLLQESTGPWNHLYYLSLILAAKCFGCRTDITAIGVDPIKGRLNRFWSRFVLNHWTDSISVRDDLSKCSLEEAEVSGPIQIRPDPVFDLPVSQPVQSPEGIALALCPRRDLPSWPKDVARLVDRLASELKMPVDLLVFFPGQDEVLAQEVARHSSGVRHLRFAEDPLEIIGWIPQYRLIIASRFHALVLAARASVPFVGWGPQAKVRALCQSQNMPYRGIEEWNESEQFELIAALFKTKSKSDILATRIG